MPPQSVHANRWEGELAAGQRGRAVRACPAGRRQVNAERIRIERTRRIIGLGARNHKRVARRCRCDADNGTAPQAHRAGNHRAARGCDGTSRETLSIASQAPNAVRYTSISLSILSRNAPVLRMAGVRLKPH